MKEIRRRSKKTNKKQSSPTLKNDDMPTKKVNVSFVFICLLFVSFVCGMTLLGFFFYDYHTLRKSMGDVHQMAQKIIDQQTLIAQQRMQIQDFADQIDTLDEKLARLNQFEEQVRQLANLEPYENEERLSGVGGATPESLDARLELQQNHDRLLRDMHRQITDLETISVRTSGSLENLVNKLEKQSNLLASTPSIRPTEGWISSPFGKRSSPFTGRKEFHKGLDIANHKGTSILATANGVIIFAGQKRNMGNVLVIDHGHGIITRYAHLDEMLKKRGDKVKRGDIIGHMGSTGRSTGPHLHYEVRLNGVPVNPQKYILN